MNEFKDMLSYFRKREGLTQKELAEKTGLKRAAIGNYEQGTREPDFETLEILADFFNVNMSTLLGNEERPYFEFSSEEGKLILAYRKASDSDRKVINILLEKYK